MPNLELSEHEKETLAELLETEIGDLGTEIAGTDSVDYRSGLKAKKAIATAILERLRKTAG